MDFRRVTIAELATQVQAREVSARDLVAHTLEQIERHDPVLNAFVAVDGERAMADATAIDERIAGGDAVGPLAGIPLAVKDLEDAIGFVTTFGSAVHANDAPATDDSILVARLRAAGCIVIGKTNTPEHGFKAATDNPTFGTTANPWNPECTPGGSSGGSAAALASGMVPLATGSDGGGSIRIPASLCGFSGLKPSQGRIALGGPRPSATAVLSVRGPMALRIRDVALALDSCVGPDPSDVFALAGIPDPWHPQLIDVEVPERVVYCPTMGFASVDSEVAAAVDGAVDALEAAGTEVVRIDSVFESDPVLPWFQLWCATRARAQGHLRGTPDWELIDPELRSLIDFGEQVTGVDVVRAIDACHLINRQMEAAAFTHAPVLICPTVAGQVPRLGAQGTIDGVESQGWVSFTPFVNLSRNPAGSVNVGFTAAGMPIGMQVIGRQRDDLTVLQALTALEDLMAIDRLAPVG